MTKIFLIAASSLFFFTAVFASDLSILSNGTLPRGGYDSSGEVPGGLIAAIFGDREDRTGWIFQGCVMDRESCYWLSKENGFGPRNYRSRYNKKFCTDRGERYACFGIIQPR